MWLKVHKRPLRALRKSTFCPHSIVGSNLISGICEAQLDDGFGNVAILSMIRLTHATQTLYINIKGKFF